MLPYLEGGKKEKEKTYDYDYVTLSGKLVCCLAHMCLHYLSHLCWIADVLFYSPVHLWDALVWYHEMGGFLVGVIQLLGLLFQERFSRQKSWPLMCTGAYDARLSSYYDWGIGMVYVLYWCCMVRLCHYQMWSMHTTCLLMCLQMSDVSDVSEFVLPFDLYFFLVVLHLYPLFCLKHWRCGNWPFPLPMVLGWIRQLFNVSI